MILFSIFNNKKNKLKIKKMGAGPAWMRRGTQGHVAAPRGPVQRAYVARIYLILYYTYIYKRGLCPPHIGEGHTLINRRVI